jgi:type I restriction enzyme M protein
MTETKALLSQIDMRLGVLEESKKDEKRKVAALLRDKTALLARLAEIDSILTSIGGQLTDAEAKALILRKLYDVAAQALHRYLNAEKERLSQNVERVWDKYAVPIRALEDERAKRTTELDGLLRRLGYFR